MAKRVCSRRDLLDRWRGIEEEDEAAASSEVKQREVSRLKEQWFLDAFNFLISLPKDTHVWCGSWDLMGPLLETFYNYFKDKSENSPLKLLWKRISQELRRCSECICQHHQAQEMYGSEYESSTVGPLLTVLQNLDEERVTAHLKEINGRMARGEHYPETHDAEVVAVMFEEYDSIKGRPPIKPVYKRKIVRSTGTVLNPIGSVVVSGISSSIDLGRAAGNAWVMRELCVQECMV